MSLIIHESADDSKTSRMENIRLAVLQLINNVLNANEVVKSTFDVNRATGTDLEELSKIFRLERLQNETDTDFRTRIINYVPTRTPLTVNGIEETFERLTGIRPRVEEDFVTKFLKNGANKDPDDTIAFFRLLFPVEVTRLSENLIVNEDGETLSATSSFINQVTPNLEIYDIEADKFLLTNLAGTVSGSTITIDLLIANGGLPYNSGTEFLVRYDIVPDELFDTLTEVTEATSTLYSILQRSKAAGVKTTLEYIFEMTSWFQSGIEDLVIIDVLTDFVLNFFELPPIPDDDNLFFDIPNYKQNENYFLIYQTTITDFGLGKFGIGTFGYSTFGATLQIIHFNEELLEFQPSTLTENIIISISDTFNFQPLTVPFIDNINLSWVTNTLVFVPGKFGQTNFGESLFGNAYRLEISEVGT